jgi:hypothetical protein
MVTPTQGRTRKKTWYFTKPYPNQEMYHTGTEEPGPVEMRVSAQTSGSRSGPKNEGTVPGQINEA